MWDFANGAARIPERNLCKVPSMIRTQIHCRQPMIPTYGDKPFESQRNPCTLCRFAFHPRLQILKELIRANADIRDLDRFYPNLHASASLGFLGVMGEI